MVVLEASQVYFLPPRPSSLATSSSALTVKLVRSTGVVAASSCNHVNLKLDNLGILQSKLFSLACFSFSFFRLAAPLSIFCNVAVVESGITLCTTSLALPGVCLRRIFILLYISFCPYVCVNVKTIFIFTILNCIKQFYVVRGCMIASF